MASRKCTTPGQVPLKWLQGTQPPEGTPKGSPGPLQAVCPPITGITPLNSSPFANAWTMSWFMILSQEGPGVCTPPPSLCVAPKHTTPPRQLPSGGLGPFPARVGVWGRGQPLPHVVTQTASPRASPGLRNRLTDNSVPWSPWQQSRPPVSRETKASASRLPQQRLWVQSATLSCQLRGAAGRPGQRSQVLPVLGRRCGASARTQVPAQPGSQVESLGPKSPCFLLSPVHQPVMSSASSEPGNGDSAEQSQLGLDTVIKVSAVATLQHPPGSGG